MLFTVSSMLIFSSAGFNLSISSLSSARKLKSKILTGDAHFNPLIEAIMIE